MSRHVENQPHDEVFNVSDEDGVGSESAESDDGGRALGKSADDDDFDFASEFGRGGEDSSPSKGAKTKVVTNQPFDEAVDLSASDGSSAGSSPHNPTAAASLRSPANVSTRQSVAPAAAPRAAAAVMPKHSEQQRKTLTVDVGKSSSPSEDGGDPDEDQEEEDEDEEESSDGSDGEKGGSGLYNPSDYAHLDVSSEIKDLFQYIQRYKPQKIDLETRLKPFIPDFIPAVGDIDPFIKIPRPDGKDDVVGLIVLDEPAANQTDPTVLDLQLRTVLKQSNMQPVAVSSVENASQQPKKITDWIASINDLHRKKPPPNVKYTRGMPDIQTLMQVWPADMEECIAGEVLPSAELDLDVSAFGRVCCAMLDIPVHQSLKESLHVFFTLYLEFKATQDFQAGGDDVFAALRS